MKSREEILKEIGRCHSQETSANELMKTITGDVVRYNTTRNIITDLIARRSALVWALGGDYE